MLIIFNTTVSVSGTYRTSRVVIALIIRFYITVVVISFCIIVLCSFVALLLIVDGIRYINLLKPTGFVIHQQFNVLNPTGYVTHQHFNPLKPTG